MPVQWEGVPAGAAGGQSVATAHTADLSEWWKSFNDPQLTLLIEECLRSNLTLLQARTRILQAREARIITRSRLFPEVISSGTISGSRSAIGELGTRTLFQAGLDSAWELDFFGGIRRAVEAADANIQFAIEDSRDFMVILTSETAVNYAQLRGFQQQLTIAEKNLALQLRTLDITQKRFEVGFASGLDVANAKAQVAATESTIPVLESAAQQAIYRISVLLGREPVALLPELSPRADIPITPPVVPVGLPSELLQRRPDIRRAEALLHITTAEIGVARSDFFPRFSLTGSAGVQSLVGGTLGSLAGTFWSIGPGFTLPIFTAGRIKANVRLQTAEQQEAFLAYRQSIFTALQDVESALIAYSKDQRQRASLIEAVRANERAVELATQAYTSGQVDFLNVLTAQQNLYSSEEALAQSTTTIATDLIALYKALGGGWSATIN